MSRLGVALLAEHRKLVTTRLWWLLAIVMFAYLAFLGAVLAFSFTAEPPAGTGPGSAGGLPPLSGREAALTTYGVLNAVGYVFPLIIGSLAVTTEFRHRTITQSLLAEPNRGVLMTAKLLGTVPVGLAFGVVGAVGMVAGAAPMLAWQGEGAFLGDGEVWRVLALGVVVIALWAVLGVALGTVIPNQVAAVVVILAFTQFVEPIARAGLGAVDALSGVGSYLPGAAADAIVGTSLFGRFSGGGSAELLPAWAGALVLLAYTVVLAGIGWRTTMRRDVT